MKSNISFVSGVFLGCAIFSLIIYQHLPVFNDITSLRNLFLVFSWVFSILGVISFGVLILYDIINERKKKEGR